MKKIIITSVLVCAVIFSQAQQWTIHNVAPIVTSIAFDGQENIYFGTNQGINNFKGLKLANYYSFKLPLNTYRSWLVIDQNEYKWLGYDEIYAEYNTTYEELHKIGGDTTLYILGNGSPYNSVQCMVVDATNKIWVGTYNGVYMWDGIKWTNYSTKDGLAVNNVRSIAIDRKGNKWFGTNGGGLSKFDGIKWVTYTTNHGLLTDYIRSLAVDHNDHLWIGSNSRGVCKFNGSQFVDYSQTSNLQSDSIGEIITDKAQNIWFAGRKGLTKFNGTKWTFYGFKPDSSYLGYTSNIAFDKQGNPWIGTYEGVYVLNQNYVSGLLDEHKTEHEQISVVPNPFSQTAQITLPENGMYEIKIINLQGKQMDSYITTGKIATVNLGNLPRGIYRLEAAHTNGNTYSSKLLLQ